MRLRLLSIAVRSEAMRARTSVSSMKWIAGLAAFALAFGISRFVFGASLPAAAVIAVCLSVPTIVGFHFSRPSPTACAAGYAVFILLSVFTAVVSLAGSHRVLAALGFLQAAVGFIGLVLALRQGGATQRSGQLS
jgi:hypothetical protein